MSPLTWLYRRLTLGAFTVRTPGDAPLLFLLVMAGVGLYAAADLSSSLPAFWRLLLGLALYYGLANGVRDRRTLGLLTLLLAGGGFLLALVTVLGVRWDAVRLLSLPQLYGRLPALLRDPSDNQSFNPRVMGMGLAVLFPALLSLALFGRARKLRLAGALSALALAIIFPLTQAVQALLGIGVALAFLAIWRTRWSLLGLLPLVGLLGWALARYDLRPLAARLLSTGDLAGIGVALRLDMWARALAMIRDMPFTGIGLNNFQAIQWNFYPGFLLGQEPHAHNLFLQVALDLGLPGLMAFLWLIIAAMVMAARAYRLTADRDGRALIVGLVAGLLAYLGAGLIDCPWASKPGLLLWVLLGMLAALYGLSGAATQERTSRRPAGLRYRRLAPALAPVLLVLTALVAGNSWDTNRGSIEGHKALLAARTAGANADPAALAEAAGHLARGLGSGARSASGSASAYSLLGSLYAWQGDDRAALEAFGQQVALDGQDPLAEYAPFEALRRQIIGQASPDRWAALLGVYGQWMARFPQHAEPYVWAALVHGTYQNDQKGAVATLRSGLQRGAQPTGLLQACLDDLASAR